MKKRSKKNDKMTKMTRGIFVLLAIVIAAVIAITAIISRQKESQANRYTQEEHTDQAADVTSPDEAEAGADDLISQKSEAEETERGEETEREEQTEGEEETESVQQLKIPVWVTAPDVNFRSQPDTDSDVLQKLSRNTELVLQYEKDGWGAVEYNGESGYVSLQYLTREEPVTNGYVIVIDPGHQGKGDSTKEPNGPNSAEMKARVTGGTSGCVTGVMEYELNLAVSLKLRDELEARGYTVYMTRETHDVNISNMERAQYATSVNADVSVRIHANGAENSSVSGALAPSSNNPYISNLSAASQNLSQCILDAYCKATGMNNQGVISSDTMTGINWSTVPVTILEMGYMTNPSDDANMEDADYQQKMVQGIANGIDDYFGI